MRSRRSPSSGASPTQLLDQRLAFVGAERLEQERRRVQLAAAPARPYVEQLGARDAEQEDRRVAREVGDVLDEVDEHRLGPLQVVDTTTCGRSAARASSSRRNASCVSGGDVPMIDVGLDADRDQDLDERPVRDPLAVREAAAAQDVGRVADALEEVRDEARLPDAGGPEEREEPARAVGDGVLVVAPEALALALAADERRLEVARERVRRRSSTSRSRNASTGSRLPLQRERLDRLDADGVADERARLGADQDLAGAAACSSRAATLTASPVTSVSPSPPTTTSPVLTPIRASSPCSRDRVAHLRPPRARRAARRPRARPGSRRRP